MRELSKTVVTQTRRVDSVSLALEVWVTRRRTQHLHLDARSVHQLEPRRDLIGSIGCGIRKPRLTLSTQTGNQCAVPFGVVVAMNVDHRRSATTNRSPRSMKSMARSTNRSHA